MTNTLPKDQNNIVYEGHRDTVGNRYVARQAGTVTTENGVNSAPGRIEATDGALVTVGATTDVAVTSDANGTLSAKLRGLVKMLADIWDSVNHRVRVDGSGVTQPVSGTVAVSNLPGTQPVSGSVSVSNFPATQPISAAALPLPTGAATAAKQPALGTAGTPSSDVLTVQGATSMTALKTDGSGVTQPVSAASLPLPSGAATEAGHLATIDTSTAAISTATGAQADSAWTSGSGSIIGLLKAVVGKLASLVTNTTSLAPTAGYVSVTGTATSAGSDSTATFASQVRHWLLQNNTSANVQFELDTAASAGSIVLAPGATWLSDIPVTVLHLYTAAVQNINGSTAGNIVVKGWA